MSHVDTQSVARDMDGLRAALGASSINYFGGSYGTLLGAVYATLFPERVRAFVLDSAVMPAFDRRELLREQAAGYERAFAEYLERCENSADCSLRDLGDAAHVYDLVRAFVAASDELPIDVDERQVRGADLRLGMEMALDAGGGPGLDEALVKMLEGEVRSLLDSADGWYGRGDDGVYDDDVVDANLAISALDAPFPGGRADFDAFVEAEVLPESPLFAPRLAEVERTFVEWPFVLARPLPTVHAPGAPPLLILAGEGDPATPAHWSEAMRDALANGSRVITHGAPLHGQLFRSQCVRELAVPFLIDPSALPAEAYCPPDPEE